MLFNSLDFIFFLIIVFILYWFVFNKNLKAQNFFVFLSSYVFYGWWDWRFLFLIFLSSLVGYFSVFLMERSATDKQRKFWLILTITINLLFLGFFKYFNFFSSSFQIIIHSFGFKPDFFTLNILLPIGISFYTFHNISYVMDVYRKHIPVCKSPIVYLSFISYFPQLVAGPIQRAKDLIPQFQRSRTFNYKMAANGMEQILWGFFKKIVIADNCSILANKIFDNYDTLSGAELIMGTIYFAFQIYGDFSGYTDIALGVSKLFGITLTQNFKTPYFAKSIPEFWKRWHISLTTWFKDYVYIPLGGSKRGKLKTLQNTIIIFLISGLWHGANWTFIFWGFINALFFIPSIFIKRKVNSEIKSNNFNVIDLLQMALTFSLISFAWIFFRAENLSHAFAYIDSMINNNFKPKSLFLFSPFKVLPLLITFLVVEWLIFKYENDEFTWNKFSVVKWPLYLCIIFIILMNINFNNASEFIYFQF